MKLWSGYVPIFTFKRISLSNLVQHIVLTIVPTQVKGPGPLGLVLLPLRACLNWQQSSFVNLASHRRVNAKDIVQFADWFCFKYSITSHIFTTPFSSSYLFGILCLLIVAPLVGSQFSSSFSVYFSFQGLSMWLPLSFTTFRLPHLLQLSSTATSVLIMHSSQWYRCLNKGLVRDKGMGVVV